MSGHEVRPGERPYAVEDLPTLPAVDAASFFAVDLRIGRVHSVTPLEGARKPAYVLEVDFGPVLGLRTATAQLTHLDPDELTGRAVVGVVNIGRRRVAGVVSEFLVLAGLAADGTAHPLAPAVPLPPGSRVA